MRNAARSDVDHMAAREAIKVAALEATRLHQLRARLLAVLLLTSKYACKKVADWSGKNIHKLATIVRSAAERSMRGTIAH